MNRARTSHVSVTNHKRGDSAVASNRELRTFAGGRDSGPQLSRRTFLGGALGTVLSTSLMRASAQEPLIIATSMPILQDIVSNIAGDTAQVFSIMPANADPHTWEAAPEDMVRLTEADAFIFNGADLEPFVDTGGWRAAVEDNEIPEFVVADHVDLIEVDEVIDHGDHEHELTGGDPHIWLDPLTIMQAIPAIAIFLGELDSDNAETFVANADQYKNALEELHVEITETLSVIPEERRKLLVFHDAWRYFAARYDFEVIGIVLENPNAEVSAQEMVHLLHTIEDHGVNVIFAEPQFNTSVLNLLQDEGNIEIVTLLTDSFAEDAESYIELMRFNANQLATSLGE